MAVKFNPFTGKLEEYGPVLSGTGTVSAAADGTAAIPGISFANDLNTGIYRPGPDQLAISTNGTGRLFVDASGNVGVGISSPANGRLNISSTTNQIALDTTDTATYGRLDIGHFTNGTFIGTYAGSNTASDLIRLGTGGTERLRITSTGQLSHIGAGSSSTPAVSFSGSAPVNSLVVDSSGRCGIATSSPSYTLDVAGSIRSTGGTTALRLENTSNAGIYQTFSRPNKSYIAALDINNNGGKDFTLYDATASAARITISDTGAVGIGVTSPQGLCDVAGSNGRLVLANGNTSGGMKITATNSAYNANGYLAFEGYSSEYGRFDSSGRLLVGTSSSSASTRAVFQGNSFAGSQPGIIYLQRDTSSIGLTAGTAMGYIIFADNAGSNYAVIGCEADASTGTNDYPSRLVFSTTEDGASSPTERIRITSDGSISTKTVPTSLSAVGTTIFGASSVAPNAVNITRSSGYVLAINRTTDDGNLVEFYQDTTIEGTISVSGTTVSYNGAHLSRWSQLPSGQEREEILRGTVLSNIDEMCEWDEEDNEQLNRMKVSDVEGDKNVSGVFQAWDDDDDTYTNDFYCAMTGDFIIRIAQGVTVERGDLLISAGDGTAKPQDDDIIRSKTIAKVTSTNVTCTYPDGSYCVPCVLMAC